MKRLLYVPIIHSEADLGSAGAALARESSGLTGERRWAIHREIVGKFWDSVAGYLRSLDFGNLKVYQDGLAADGQMGRRIVEGAAKRGSQNYQLLLEMLDAGAKCRKTEDPLLLLQERDNLLGLLGEDPPEANALKAQEFRTQRDLLVEERDKFIAKTIGATLQEGELGVLFIGAYHNVVAHLPDDISVEAVKEPGVVTAYLEQLFQGHDDRQLEELGRRLAAPVSLPPAR